MRQAGTARHGTGRYQASFGTCVVFAMLLAGIGLGTAVSSVTVEAAGTTFTVTTTADDVNNALCNGTANGGCTLRQAVNASNAMGGIGTNTIIFALDAPASAPITLSTASGGALTPTANVTIDATTPLHVVTLRGGGTGSNLGLFYVNGPITLGLRGLILTNGGNNGVVATEGGGAVDNTGGTVNVVGCTFSGNFTARDGGAIFNTNTDFIGTVTGGVLNIVNSTFSGNTAGTGAVPGQGGAIANLNGTVTVVGSTFSGNSSPFGGAIRSDGGTLAVVNSTFSGNTTRFSGGAISSSSTLTLVGSTFTGNATTDAFGSGGAISTASNRGTLRLALSTIAGNTAPFSPDINATVTTDDGGNVVGDIGNTTGLTAPSDRLGTTAAPLNPLLAPLSLHAPGTVQTVALLPGSPAIDLAACPADPTTNTPLAADARGITRPQVIACDAGAFESRGFTTGALTGNSQSATVRTAFADPVGLTVSSAFNEPISGGQITYTITPGTGGASAAFPAAGGCTLTGATVAVCPIATNGIATSPAFTANTILGAFTIVATTTGIATPAVFTETNTLLSGTAPAAANDTYTTTAGVVLTVPPAMGVLANDRRGTPIATITANTPPAHGTLTLNTDGSFTYTPAAGFAGTDAFTYTLTNSGGSSTASVTLTVTAVTLTGITVTAPTGSGSGNSGSATMITLRPGGSLTVSVEGNYSNGATGPVNGLTYTSGAPSMVAVDATGTITGLTATNGTPITVTVTAPNGVTRTITVTVSTAMGSGLIAPAPQPGVHAIGALSGATPPVSTNSSAVSTPAPQPARR